jgi:hypothetical protein
VDIGKNKQFVALIFWVKVSNFQIILNQEDHQAYAWIQPSEIGKYKTVEYLKDCIVTYLELINN